MTDTILISINTSWNIYHFRHALTATLKKSGYSVATAAPDDAYTARLRAMVDSHHPLPIDNAGTSPLNDIALFFRYRQLLSKLRPAAMLTYTIKPNIYGALAARTLGIPVIANVSGLGTAFIRDSWLTSLVKLLYRFAFRDVACVFFQNPEDRDLFLQMKLVAPEKTALLPGSGIDLDYFSPILRTHNTAASTTFVLIARLLWDKGIGEYAAAARIVKATNTHATFRLVGPLGVKNQTAIPAATIEGWTAEGIIDYLGESDDIREIIAEHDCVVLPSYREGLSRVLIEAAAMGKPLIATDVPGCRQVVENGANGLLCKPHDANDLANTMIRFINTAPLQRAEMGAASRAKAEREFDEKHILKAYLDKIAALKSTA